MGKTTYTSTWKRDWLLIVGKTLFFKKNPNFIKVNLPTHACLRRDCKLFLTLKLLSYSKCKDLLHPMNVYKIPEKEQKVVDRWSAYEILVL